MHVFTNKVFVLTKTKKESKLYESIIGAQYLDLLFPVCLREMTSQFRAIWLHIARKLLMGLKKELVRWYVIKVIKRVYNKMNISNTCIDAITAISRDDVLFVCFSISFA